MVHYKWTPWDAKVTQGAKPFLRVGATVAGCVNCGRGFHNLCSRCCKGNCCSPQDNNVLQEEEDNDSNDDAGPRSRKSAKENLRDPLSTGRKRAAEVYKIDSDTPCEWRNLRNCGGGLRPIIGCYDGFQRHRHHGPVKDTVRNELGNVHRICHDCHNHWHELNDLIYDERKYNLLPHQPIPATEQECVEYRLSWLSGKMGKEFQLASSKNKGKNHDITQDAIQSQDSD